MAYGDILQDLREGLAVSASYDGRLMRGISNAARSLLRAYNFREALRRADVAVQPATRSFALPGDCGKIKAVRLYVVEGNTTSYKTLRRREEGTLPYYAGPSFYWIEAGYGLMDSPLPHDAVGYRMEIWYQSDDPVFAEPWLSKKFADVLEHKAGTEQSLKMRKTEAFQIYSQLWQEDVAILGRYMPELEFGDMDLSMGDRQREQVLDRYPAI
jgi:hypothetical protein